ncbi:MAG: hypothetical protein EOP06_28935 [Proteobacteria bacterium]|nr:MAG: hypothetical protein EOP06_28935 [Pseudomonadota bacterium]
MKNILLALASFIMVSVLLLQVALAEEVDEYGYAVRKTGTLTSEDPNEAIKDAGNPKKIEGNAFVPGGDKCTDCEIHVWNKALNRKDTKYIPRNANTDVEGNPSNPRSRR